MKFAVCIAVLFFVGAQASANFDYTTQDEWGEHFADCDVEKQKFQSPRALFTGVEDESLATGHSPLNVDVSSEASGVFKNNGHTLQLSFEDNEDVVGTLSSTGPKGLFAADAGFELIGLNFHSPSEHVVVDNGADRSTEDRIQRRNYDLEQHLVFQGTDGALAIVGVFYTAENDQANAGLSILLGAIPVVGQSRDVEAINLNALLPAAGSPFYSYVGSTTAPPCVPGVHWNIFRDALDVSEDQLARFNKFYRGNNRDIQPTNGKFSVLNGPSPFSSPFPDLEVTYEYPQ